MNHQATSMTRLALLAALLALASAAPAQQIAFTWDDLPAHGQLPPGVTRVQVGKQLIAAMQSAHLPPAWGFVNGVHTTEEPDSIPMLKDWRDAGYPLGNHTWSHPNLNQMPLADWEANLARNEPLLQSLMPAGSQRWIRFPYLGEGDTPEKPDPAKRDAARKYLAAHGYKIAAVTTSFADYLFNGPYARCVAKNDTAAIAQLEKTYLDAAAGNLDFSRAMSQALFKRDIPYVLLMHVGAFDARMLPRLIQLYQSKGVTFVSLEDAEKDPFYANDLDLSLPGQPDNLEGAMAARGLPFPPHPKLDVDPESLCK
jgi:peptidoglycan/xylan/chitin deacetylase (PgdA/CDA1 family)